MKKTEDKVPTIKPEELVGMRKPKDGELEYLKDLLLCFLISFFGKIFLLLISLCMITLPIYGIYKLITVAVPILIESLNFIDIAILIFAFVFLCFAFVGGVKLLKDFISDHKRTKALKSDILNGNFEVIDVKVIDWHYNPDQETCESLVVISDYNGNVADSEFTTVNWQEIKNSGDKGVIAIIENKETGEKNVFRRIFPCYDENNSICIKTVKHFQKKNM